MMKRFLLVVVLFMFFSVAPASLDVDSGYMAEVLDQQVVEVSCIKKLSTPELKPLSAEEINCLLERANSQPEVVELEPLPIDFINFLISSAQSEDK